MKKLLIVSALILLASCAHQNQQVNINLSFDDAKSNIGHGAGIDLMVFDDRIDSKIIGTKKFSHDEIINITTKDNLAVLLTQKIGQDLINKGFVNGSDKVVELHIEKLNYEAKREFFVGASDAEAVIKVIVKSNKNKLVITKNFSLSLNNKHFIAPLQSTDAATINSLLQEIIQDILSNESLLKILAQ